MPAERIYFDGMYSSFCGYEAKWFLIPIKVFMTSKLDILRTTHRGLSTRGIA
jgi:hypothetical protein